MLFCSLCTKLSCDSLGFRLLPGLVSGSHPVDEGNLDYHTAVVPAVPKTFISELDVPVVAGGVAVLGREDGLAVARGACACFR